MSGAPSTSVATLTSDANGCPVLRSMVASEPARVARNRPLAIDFGSKSGRRGVFRQAIGHEAGQGGGGAVGTAEADFIGFGHNQIPFLVLTYAVPSHENCPDFALSGHTSAPTWGLRTCGAGL